jgi:hypothetical protein
MPWLDLRITHLSTLQRSERAASAYCTGTVASELSDSYRIPIWEIVLHDVHNKTIKLQSRKLFRDLQCNFERTDGEDPCYHQAQYVAIDKLS